MVKEKRNRDIRNILAVLGTAIICAGLLASIFLYYYSPSGRYRAGNTLLDPIIIEQIHYQDQHSRTGKKMRFVFDHIEFVYFDPKKGRERIPSIAIKKYQEFYTLVANEMSLKEVTREIQDLFLKSRPFVLSMSMKTTEGSDNVTAQIFQVVQFVQEDYFRVQLHEKEEGEWAYFYHPGLYRDIMQLFTQM